MWCGLITLFPEMFSGFLSHGMVSQAQRKGLLNCQFWNPRDFAGNRHRTVDDRPYGGGPGMVMQAEPLRQAVLQAKEAASQSTRVICMSPDGVKLDTVKVRQLATEQKLIIISGRYEGIDQRFIDQDVDELISIGDYVLTGGELPAMVLLDAITRFVPGVLGDESSNLEDSFTQESGGLLDCPHYTRPVEWSGQRVPDVLLSGDHQAIAAWRDRQRFEKTKRLRSDLIANIGEVIK